MSFLEATGLGGWTGDISFYLMKDAPAKFGNSFAQNEHLRLVKILDQLATTPVYRAGNPKANNDQVDTAGIGRPFRAGALWVDSTTDNMFVCSGSAVGAATWKNLSGITEISSSCSSASSSSCSTASETSSSSTVAGNTSSSSCSSDSSSSSPSSDSTMSSSSSSSSTEAGNTSSSSCSCESSSSSSA